MRKLAHFVAIHVSRDVTMIRIRGVVIKCGVEIAMCSGDLVGRFPSPFCCARRRRCPTHHRFVGLPPQESSTPAGLQSAVAADQKVFARQEVKNSATVADSLSPYRKGGRPIRPSAADSFVLPNYWQDTRPSAADSFVLPNQWQDTRPSAADFFSLTQQGVGSFGHQQPTHLSCPTSGKTLGHQQPTSLA
ncbi:hypothetical protein niasHT_002992 [Heterodera trifolii]|uniref:Uncharacterized protein n=1 Tax=Heterodera trifolii TaxID=157864 RepID=A0ABD2LP55_9BILA